MMEEACDAVAKQVGDRFDEMEQERGLAPTGVNLNGPAAPPPSGVGARCRRRREPDSPEVARLKQKLDVAAAFLLFAIAAILARRFLAHVASGDEF